MSSATKVTKRRSNVDPPTEKPAGPANPAHIQHSPPVVSIPRPPKSRTRNDVGREDVSDARGKMRSGNSENAMRYAKRELPLV